MWKLRPVLWFFEGNASRVVGRHCERLIHSSNALRVELTANQYPTLERGNYSELTTSDVDTFRSILSENRVLTDPDELTGYNTDWMRTIKGQGQVVLRPKTTEEISAILTYCNDRKLAVCPQGGNTGLVGGSVPVFDEVILSLGLMNKILNVDTNSSVATVEAGVVLEQLDNHLAGHELMVPLDLGAKGSCQLGGNVSTNAGGLRLLRYGNLHGSVLGVEAVLSSGEVVDCLNEMVKDNTGYDLKHLFIGSEGTLGVVTKLSLLCPPRPKAINLAFLGLESYDAVLKTFRQARGRLGEILSSCEFMDAGSMECVTGNLPAVKNPISEQNFYMLIETLGSNTTHDEEKLHEFLDDLMNSGTINDGTVANSSDQIRQIWECRERLAEALLVDGYGYKYDISLPHNVFYEIVPVMRNRLGADIVRCIGYGHIGDGNLHLNITSKVYDQDVYNRIEPYLYEWTHKQKGSISAEHGLGFKKRNFMHLAKSANAIKMMKQLKTVFDPNGILNPYKVLPDSKG